MSSFLPIPSPPSVVSPPPRVVPPAWPRAVAAISGVGSGSRGAADFAGSFGSFAFGLGWVRSGPGFRWRFYKTYITLYKPYFIQKNKWGYSMYIWEYHPFTHLRNGCLNRFSHWDHNHESSWGISGKQLDSDLPSDHQTCLSGKEKNSFSWIFPDSSHLYTHLVRGFPSQPIPAMFDPPFATRVGWIATRRKRSHISFILADNKWTNWLTN